MNYEPYLVEQSMLAMLNAALCVVAMVILLCRLNAMSEVPRVRMSVRLAHVVGVGAVAYSIISFSVDDWPSGARIALILYILAELLASRHAWHSPRGDAPPPSATSPSPLGER